MMSLVSPPSTEDRNWRNAGNWHWVTKDATQFAQDYLTRELCTISLDVDGIFVNVTEVNDITGDCELNVRKGKLITIYDLSLTMKWRATGPDDLSSIGTISIPEISHDIINDESNHDDLVLNISINSDSRQHDPVRHVLRKHMRNPILKILRQFSHDLITCQSDGVYIEGAIPSAHLPTADLEERKRLAQFMDSNLSFADTFSVEQRMGKKTTTTTTPATTTANTNNNNNNNNKSSTTSTTTSSLVTTSTSRTTSSSSPSSSNQSNGLLTKSVSLRCSISDAVACFTELDRMRHWTQGQCDLSKDNQWYIFGQVSANLITTNIPTQIILDNWRLVSWPKDMISKVIINIKQDNDETKLSLNHSNIPLNEKSQLDNHWSQVFNRIKMVFGYGSFL